MNVAQPLGRDRRVDVRRRGAVELVLLGVRARGRRSRAARRSARAAPGGGGSSSSQTACCARSTSARRDDAAADQLVGPQLADALVRLDRGVHLGLRVGRLVGLVVAEAAVADQVDQDVVAPALAEREREPHRRDARLDVVGVDVDDRDVEALREVRGPARRARVVGVGREADLVVGDQVQRAADGVAVERLQVERLGDDALRRGTRRRRGSRSTRRSSVSRSARGPSWLVCAARVAPITTGATYSRCDGLDSRLTWIDSPDGEPCRSPARRGGT